MIAPRMGFDERDTAYLVALVRHHLLLPDIATRRDLDDPATIDMVAEAVGNPVFLDLLHALTEADSLATGSSAWSPWKAELVEELVERVRMRLGVERWGGVRPRARLAVPDGRHLGPDGRRRNCGPGRWAADHRRQSRPTRHVRSPRRRARAARHRRRRCACTQRRAGDGCVAVPDLRTASGCRLGGDHRRRAAGPGGRAGLVGTSRRTGPHLPSSPAAGSRRGVGAVAVGGVRRRRQQQRDRHRGARAGLDRACCIASPPRSPRWVSTSATRPCRRSVPASSTASTCARPSGAKVTNTDHRAEIERALLHAVGSPS